MFGIQLNILQIFQALANQSCLTSLQFTGLIKFQVAVVQLQEEHRILSQVIGILDLVQNGFAKM